MCAVSRMGHARGKSLRMERNARAKRNPTGTERNYYIGCRYNRERKPEGRPKKKLPHGEGVSETAETIAREEGVSRATVERAAKMAKHVDDICIGSLAFLKWVILTERIKYKKKQMAHREPFAATGAGCRLLSCHIRQPHQELHCQA